MKAIYDHVLEFYPQLGRLSDESLKDAGAWVGVMPFSADGRPFVGSLEPLDPKYRGVWVAGRSEWKTWSATH